MDDDYDPLLDDESVDSLNQQNHEWMVRVIKHAKEGNFKKKRLTLFPRSRRSLETHCQSGDYLMCYWEEDQNSRLLFESLFVPDGKETCEEVL